ncbi:MAG: biotin/lipoyl-binding protein, partial [Actinomycetota bacterium]|nr:biotin/lipoyl-binding protein [Actinomycetota bacterium]
PHPFGVGDGWRLAGPAASVAVELDDTVLQVDRATGRVADGHQWWVRPVAALPGLVRLEIDDVLHEAHVEVGPHEVTVAHEGQPHVFTRPDAFAPGGGAAVSDGSVTAPMPGSVLSVAVRAGDRVAAGDTLAVLEAMKMELALKAPYAGVVAHGDVRAGEQVTLGQTLFVVEPVEQG